MIPSLFEPGRRERIAFERYLAGKVVAVVGNGPTEIGRGHGAEIDGADVVVRFNNFSVEGTFAADYGQRTDVWVTSMCSNVEDRAARFPWTACALPLGHKRWLKRYNETDRSALASARKVGAAFQGAPSFDELVTEVPNPSTGIAFVHWITRGMRVPVRFRLYGFSFFDAAAGPHHYFDRDDACFHEGDRERDYFERALKRFTL